MIAAEHAGGPSANGAAPSLAPASSRLAGSRLWTSPFLMGGEREALDQAVLPTRAVGSNIDLVREGEPVDGIIIVIDGWVCRYTTTREGRRQLSALIVPGDVANPDALMFARSDDSVRTLSKAMIAVLPRDRAVSLAEEHPGIARTFAWLSTVENAILGRWALSLGRRPAIERLAHLFCELSVRLDAEREGSSRFVLPLTQEHFADAMGLTSVHVNRTMRELRCKGLIAVADRVMTLPDVPALRRLAGFDPHYLHRDMIARPNTA